MVCRYPTVAKRLSLLLRVVHATYYGSVLACLGEVWDAPQVRAPRAAVGAREEGVHEQVSAGGCGRKARAAQRAACGPGNTRAM